jgi:hypothetical protein
VFSREVPERFEREYGCTVGEWRRWMGELLQQGHAGELLPQQLRLVLAEGTLRIDWHELPPRQIGLARLPRLTVRFAYDGVAAPAREAFQHRMDLQLQRGGG